MTNGTDTVTDASDKNAPDSNAPSRLNGGGVTIPEELTARLAALESLALSPPLTDHSILSDGEEAWVTKDIDFDGVELISLTVKQAVKEGDRSPDQGQDDLAGGDMGPNAENAENAREDDSLSLADDLEQADQAGTVPEEDGSEEDEADQGEAGKQEPTQEERILNALENLGVEFFRDRSGSTYVTVPARPGDPENEARHAHSLFTDAFPSWLKGEWYRLHKRIPSDSQLKKTMELAKMEATYNSEEREIAIGVTLHEGAIYYDLKREDGRVVRIDEEGWTIETSYPVTFLRKKDEISLPLPARDGFLKEIQSFINVSDEGLPLVLAFLLNQLYPVGTEPLLFIHGASGTGKSVAARYLKKLLDPHEVLSQSLPSGEEDLLIASQYSKILVFDNLSGAMRSSMSDNLCRLASGSGLRKRKLYKDLDEVAVAGKAGVILTSIDNVVVREDLIQRTYKVTLSEVDRIAEARLDKLFDQHRAGIMGALFDAASTGLRRLSQVEDDDSWERPRLIDAAKWMIACEPELPVENGSFLRALEDRQKDMVADRMEGNPVFEGMERYVEELGAGERKTYTATTLSTTLRDYANGVPGARALSQDLNRNKGDYEDILGLEIEKRENDREEGRRNRKLIHITKLPPEQKESE